MRTTEQQASKLRGRKPYQSAADFAGRVVSRMQTTGLNAVVFERDGAAHTVLSNTGVYKDYAAAVRRTNIICFCTPAIGVDELADDVAEYFS